MVPPLSLVGGPENSATQHTMLWRRSEWGLHHQLSHLEFSLAPFTITPFLCLIKQNWVCISNFKLKKKKKKNPFLPSFTQEAKLSCCQLWWLIYTHFLALRALTAASVYNLNGTNRNEILFQAQRMTDGLRGLITTWASCLYRLSVLSMSPKYL